MYFWSWCLDRWDSTVVRERQAEVIEMFGGRVEELSRQYSRGEDEHDNDAGSGPRYC